MVLHISLVAILYYMPNILISTILAFVIYYLVEPLVESMEDRGFPRTWAAAIPFITFGLLIFVLALATIPVLSEQIEALKNQLPQYSTNLRSLLGRWEHQTNPWISQLGGQIEWDSIQNYFLSKASGFFQQLPTILSNSLTVLLLTPFFAFFLLLDGAKVYRQFLRIVPNHIFELMINVNHSINVQMGQFIRARLIETSLIILFIYIGLSSIGFPYSLLIAIGTGFLNLIPYIGPVIAVIPQLALCLISPEAAPHLLAVLLLNLGAQIFDTVVLVPALVARIVNLHPVVVVLAVLLGGQFFGIIGMVISIPLASAIKVFLTAYYRYMTHEY